LTSLVFDFEGILAGNLQAFVCNWPGLPSGQDSAFVWLKLIPGILSLMLQNKPSS